MPEQISEEKATEYAIALLSMFRDPLGKLVFEMGDNDTLILATENGRFKIELYAFEIGDE